METPTKLNYWTMHLFPEPFRKEANDITMACLERGIIGLDHDLPNKPLNEVWSLLPNKDYGDFYKPMKPGDRVLVFLSGRPLALVTVAGDYQFLAANTDGIPFRHRRAIRDVVMLESLFGVDERPQLSARGAICKLKNKRGRTYQFIETNTGIRTAIPKAS